MTDLQATPKKNPLIPRFVRMFSVPIVLFWLGLVVVLSVAVPSLEQVSQEHTVSLAPDGRAVDAGDEAGRQDLPGVRLQQQRDDPAGERPAAGRRGAPLLRRLDPEAARRHQARRAHPGLLGRSADRRRLSERRRQGRLRPALPGRQPGRGPGQRVDRRGHQDRQRQSAAARNQGLRHRPDGTEPRSAQRRRLGRQADRGHHHRRHLRDAAVGLPLHHDGDPRAGHGVHSNSPRPAASSPSSATTNSSACRRSR